MRVYRTEGPQGTSAEEGGGIWNKLRPDLHTAVSGLETKLNIVTCYVRIFVKSPFMSIFGLKVACFEANSRIKSIYCGIN